MKTDTQAFVPELQSREQPLTHDDFNNLLGQARDIHAYSELGDSFDRLTVVKHTNTRTVMSAGNPRGAAVHLVIEDVPSTGIMLRSVSSYIGVDDDRHVEDTALLLGLYDESPKVYSAEYVSISKIMYAPPHDTDRLVSKIQNEGKTLSHDVAVEWFEALQKLAVNNLESKQRQTLSGSKRKGIMDRLFHKHVVQP